MEKGLTTSVAEKRLREHGKNLIRTQRSFSILSLLASQFLTLLNGILLMASLFAYFVHDILDSIFIFSVIILNSLFGFIQGFRAEKALEKLRSFTSPLVRVIRDGKEIQIDASLIVPGDAVIITEGDRIPADGTLTLSHHVEVDEAILTGESLPVIKSEHDAVFLGTLVLKGKGEFTATATGSKTEFGQIAQTLSSIKPDPTPLQKEIHSLGRILSLIVIGISALLIPLGLTQGKSLLELLLFAVSVGVAAIPEGLPAVITIALALGTNRMARRRAIVRSMPSVETLGSVQVIIVDKTGTLTQNVMRVKKHWIKDHSHLPALLKACILGNTANLIQKADVGKFDIIGDRTDGALLLFALSEKNDILETKKNYEIVDEYVFDAKTKTITTVVREHGEKHVFVRGAPEAILDESSMHEKDKEEIRKVFEDFAKEGLRVIAFGTKIEHHGGSLDRNHIESHLHFLGIVGIYDPPREEVQKAIREARTAGIQTIMVTGDNELTALAIAKDIGLVGHTEDVVTGEELTKIDDTQLATLIPKTRVFARAKPHDKLRLVRALKQQGYIVGVTGDGVNDALALKQADVGVAMGQTGTDVAKEASDIILTDDNFATLVAAIEEGRSIYHNIAKSITYLLSSNLSELALVLSATLLGLPAPLVPTQILWINLVTDGLPALALASSTSDGSLLKNPPRDTKTPLLSQKRLMFIGFVGLLIAVFLLETFFFSLQTFSEVFSRGLIFHLLIICHMGLAFVMQGTWKFWQNTFLLISILITLSLQFVITQLPFFQEIFNLVP